MLSLNFVFSPESYWTFRNQYFLHYACFALNLQFAFFFLHTAGRELTEDSGYVTQSSSWLHVADETFLQSGKIIWGHLVWLAKLPRSFIHSSLDIRQRTHSRERNFSSSLSRINRKRVRSFQHLSDMLHQPHGNASPRIFRSTNPLSDALCVQLFHNIYDRKCMRMCWAGGESYNVLRSVRVIVAFTCNGSGREKNICFCCGWSEKMIKNWNKLKQSF